MNRLSFAYPATARFVLRDLSFALPAGARCLLLGANGVGKSTLLRLIAGRHMIAGESVQVLGRPAFHDTALAGEVAFVGGEFPFSQDISVAEILAHRPDIDAARRAQVLSILDVDPSWRMHRVSAGQRRRVQILLDLERTLSLILLDEVTADLDVLARADLLRFLRDESDHRGLTVIYASHVLDGLAAWGTHLLFLGQAGIRRFAPLEEVPELRPSRADVAHPSFPATPSMLHALCERWMAEDRGRRGT